MPLTVAQSPLASTQNGNSGQGGTALQSEGDSNTLLIVGSIAIAGLLLFLLFRGGSSESNNEEKALETEQVTEPFPESDVVQAPVSPPLPESSVGIEVVSEDTSGIQKQRAAIAELEGRLNKSRLWSTLSPLAGSDSTLSIVSGSCEDDAMKSTVKSSAVILRDAGYSEVHCFAKHGELLFKERL